METVTEKPNVEEKTASKVIKKSGKRVGYNYIIIKSLKESQKNDVVKCLYIKSIRKFGLCVIKEGSKGDSCDDNNRDICDRLIWQRTLHKKLQDKVNLPKFIDSFEENGNFYLVIEYVKGNQLYDSLFKTHKLFKTVPQINRRKIITLLKYLTQICTLLDALHKQNFVHRDVTPANFLITARQKVYIIDLELCYSLEHILTPPFQLGTFGYMSPQQRSVNLPTIQDDIFSIGAILFQALTGIHPIKITDPIRTDYGSTLSFLFDDEIIRNLLIKCLSPNADERPSISFIKERIIEYQSDLSKKRLRKKIPHTTSFKEDFILNKIKEGINCLASPLLSDDKKGWFADDVQKENRSKNHFSKNWYASFNIGAAGVIYLLSKLKKVNIDVSETLPAMKSGLNLIEERYINRINSVNPSLYFGSSGIASSIASAYHSELIVDEKYHQWLNTLLSVESKNMFLQHGTPGIGIARLNCQMYLPNSAKEQIEREVETLLKSQQANGSWIKNDGKGNLKATRGVSNGVAGILLFLIKYSGQNKDNRAVKAIERGLSWLMKKSIRKSDALTWTSSSGKELDYGLQEGNAGIALVFLRAYQFLGDKNYSNYAQRALLTYNENLIHDDLSNNSGITGLGEVYLEAASILKDSQYYDRANHIVQVLLHLRKENNKHGTYWITGSEKKATPCFSIGNSGILHFLTRYCHTENIEFPLI